MSTNAAGPGKRVNTFDVFVGNLPQDVDQVCTQGSQDLDLVLESRS